MTVPVDRRPPSVGVPDVAPQDLERHLIQDHALDPALVRRQSSGPAPARHATRYLQMQHAVDHSQRRVGHEHNA